MDTRHVRTAVAVSRFGTFTRAARELYMAQSTLSRRVATLERDLGIDLFVRGSRRITLTPAGEAFLAHAETFLEAADRAEQAARAAGPALSKKRRGKPR